MTKSATQELVPFLKSLALRFAIGKFLATLLAGGVGLVTLAFATGFEFSVHGKIFGTEFSVRYGSGTHIALPLLVGTSLIAIAVWIYLRSQREPQSKRIESLETTYAEKGAASSVQEQFFETFGVHVSSSSELDYVMKQTNVRKIANSLRRAREHVRFTEASGYVLTKPRLPYGAIKITFTALYFVCVVALMLVAPLTIAAAVQGQVALAWSSAGFSLLFFVVAWSSLSAYTAAFHALSLAHSDG